MYMLTLRRNPRLASYIKPKTVAVVKKPRKRFQYRKRRAGFNRLVKNISLRNAETKRQIWDSATDQSIALGSLYAMNPLYQNVQGSSDGQHIGNEIFLKGFGMRALLTTPTTGSLTPYFVSVALVRSRQQISDIGEQNFNSTTITNFVRNNGHSPCWMFDSDKCSVIMKRQYKIVPSWGVYWNNTLGVAQDEHSRQSKLIKLYVPMRNIKFQYDNVTGYGKFTNYYWLIWVGSNYGVTGNCSFTCLSSTYYKDP